MTDLIALQVHLHQQALAALKALTLSGWSALPGLVGLAFTFGLLHALLPGHGKLLLATHFAGRGSWRSAFASSALVILTHVGSAIAIVLTGAAILERGLGKAGRAPALEAISHGLIAIAGLILLFSALRRRDGRTAHDHRTSGPVLAVFAGLIPCPLTTFIMTYAVVNNAMAAGLALSAAFGAGMVLTVAVLPVLSVLMRERLATVLASAYLMRALKLLEIATAALIIAVGAVHFLR